MSKLSIDTLKIQAKKLRLSLADIEQSISHSQSLEIIARQKGFKDWNTLYASIGNIPVQKYEIGQNVCGQYLGQNFTGKLLKVTPLDNKKRYGITIKFDEAVDVITFKGMSNWRNQVKLTINANGKTNEKTSNGLPHMVLEIA